MTTSDVARALQVGRSRVQQLDAQLKPTRCGCGVRCYSAEAVEAYLTQRELDRARLSDERRERMLQLRSRR